MLAFSIFRAAVFAEPAVTKIEKVVSLIQESQKSEIRGQKSKVKKERNEIYPQITPITQILLIPTSQTELANCDGLLSHFFRRTVV